MSDIPASGGHWIEPRSTANVGTGALTRLVPYKTTAGYWVFVLFGTGPTGSTQGAMVHGTYDTLVTSTTTGLRIFRRDTLLML